MVTTMQQHAADRRENSSKFSAGPARGRMRIQKLHKKGVPFEDF